MAEVHEVERLAKLEERVDNLSREVQEVKQDVRELKEDVKFLKDELHRLDKKSTIFSLLIIFLIIFLNQDALIFILKLLRIMP